MTLERDRNGRIVRETCNGRVVESRLDAVGRRIERRIGAGQAGESLVRLIRDPLGLVARIAVDNHAPLTFRRDGLGREVERRSAAGFRLDQSWDAVGQLTGQRVGARAGPGIGEVGGTGRHYAWDKAGAPTGIDDALWGATTYSYDRNGRVVEARFGEALTEGFDYDAAKNVVGVRVDGPGTGAGLGALLGAHTTPGGVVQLTHGPHGEQIALTHDVCGRVVERRVERKGFRPKLWRYGWDGHDRLVSCETPEGASWTYGYDPFGRRL